MADDLDDWEDEDEIGLSSAVVMAFAIGFVTTTIVAVAVAIAWNVVSVVSKAVQAVRRR